MNNDTQTALDALYWERTADNGPVVFKYTTKDIASKIGIPTTSIHRHVSPLTISAVKTCLRCPCETTTVLTFRSRAAFINEHGSFNHFHWLCQACQDKENAARNAARSNAREILRKRFAYKFVQDCPECEDGILIFRRGNANGGLFIGCTNYPNCKCRRTIPEPIDLTPEELADLAGARKLLEQHPRCPKCGNFLRVVPGKYGRFLGCAGYPQCKYIGDLTELTPVAMLKPDMDFDGLGL